jgi:hypothetical protein
MALSLPGSSLALAATRMRSSWSRLSWREFALAAGAGATIGGLQAIGHIITQAGPWWVHLVACLAPPIGLSLLLLLALAIAVDVEVSRAPRWMPFATAALVATLGAGLVDWMTTYVLARVTGEPWEFRPIYIADYAWSWGPYLLILAGFAAFGARQAIDARRRTDLLRRVQLERVRVAREAYESRLVALQARVEPRFLFETLSATEVLYEEDEAAGARVLDNLIVHLRAALPSTEAPSSLESELTLVRTWLDIARVRSGDRLVVAMPHGDVPSDARMPPMVLLPLVQHAALAVRDEAIGIVVSAALEGARVIVRVIGPLAAFEARREDPAVVAARERFAALYAGAGTLTVQRVAHDRSQAVLDIPYERTDRRIRGL